MQEGFRQELMPAESCERLSGRAQKRMKKSEEDTRGRRGDSNGGGGCGGRGGGEEEGGRKGEHAQSTGSIRSRLYFVSGSQRTGSWRRWRKLTKCRRRKREQDLGLEEEGGRGFGARTSRGHWAGSEGWGRKSCRGLTEEAEEQRISPDSVSGSQWSRWCKEVVRVRRSPTVDRKTKAKDAGQLGTSRVWRQ